jgi:hypothetical protein
MLGRQQRGGGVLNDGTSGSAHDHLIRTRHAAAFAVTFLRQHLDRYFMNYNVVQAIEATAEDLRSGEGSTPRGQEHASERVRERVNSLKCTALLYSYLVRLKQDTCLFLQSDPSVQAIHSVRHISSVYQAIHNAKLYPKAQYQQLQLNNFFALTYSAVCPTCSAVAPSPSALPCGPLSVQTFLRKSLLAPNYVFKTFKTLS